MFEKLKNDSMLPIPPCYLQLRDRFSAACDYANNELLKHGIKYGLIRNNDMSTLPCIREMVPFEMKYSDTFREKIMTTDVDIWSSNFFGYISLFTIGKFESHRFFRSTELIIPIVIRWDEKYSFVKFTTDLQEDSVINVVHDFLENGIVHLDFDLQQFNTLQA
jgi:hypothetical protein